MTVNPKKVICEWLEEKWNRYIRRPIENKTEQMEGQVSQTFNTYSGKAKEKISTHGSKVKETAYKPVDYYKNKPTFYRGLFWIAIVLLIVLWILSGS